jgi:hypothetical protein
LLLLVLVYESSALKVTEGFGSQHPGPLISIWMCVERSESHLSFLSK